MITLGIETSCDETAVAIVDSGQDILANLISSQIKIHRPYGGVVPELASRQHIDNLLPLIQESLNVACKEISDIQLIAVTYGPGLIGALLVGLSAAKAMAYYLDVPLVGVNHIEAHLYAPFLEKEVPKYPIMALVVSGGHTSLFYMPSSSKRIPIGSTRDDAAGEAFDKVAKFLGLSYPGGVIIDKLSIKGKRDKILFPRPMIKEKNFDFSFSGLKTAVINYLHSHPSLLDHIKNSTHPEQLPEVWDLVASFQEAVIDVLVTKTLRAAKEFGVSSIVVAGGVAANTRLRKVMSDAAYSIKLKAYFPSLELCTDNAAMVAGLGYQLYRNGKIALWDLDAVSRIKGL